jgi:hypothetical protein
MQWKSVSHWTQFLQRQRLSGFHVSLRDILVLLIIGVDLLPKSTEIESVLGATICSSTRINDTNQQSSVKTAAHTSKTPLREAESITGLS